MDIIGHTDVGKTSLSRRLLGQPFLQQTESTEGISTHHVKSQFNKFNLTTEDWMETHRGQSDVLTQFLDEVLSKQEDLSKLNDENTVIKEDIAVMINSAKHIQKLEIGKPITAIKPEGPISVQGRETIHSQPKLVNSGQLLPMIEESSEYVQIVDDIPLEEKTTSDNACQQKEGSIRTSGHNIKRMTSKVRQQLLHQQEAKKVYEFKFKR